MARRGSDHVPILVQIGSEIPKCQIFRFEEFWLDFEGLNDIVEKHRQHQGHYKNAAQDITARFKSLRHGIKKWSKHLSQLSVIISNCSYVLTLLDGLEEKRPLSTVERNFRTALTEHQSKLIEAQRLYWRKRANIRWAKLGDENTKLFHTVATRNYRHNHIASIKSEDGIITSLHDQKAAILWNAFRNRMGKTEPTEMKFDLSSLITPQDLSRLEVPFTKEEIDEVIHSMPNDKAPGPDGFNGQFMKKYWHVMKKQFYDLCFNFYSGNLDIHSLNTAFITLIPKINSPETPSDFRPISLNTLNCFATPENDSMEKDKWSLDGNSVKYSTKKRNA
ncbi:uncharacterized protein [Lolium perenne]|uniref:uncharacterized protein n=1 Tax=Lolium perenne TaxID=4522 RepID=UPI003A98D3D1